MKVLVAGEGGLAARLRVRVAASHELLQLGTEPIRPDAYGAELAGLEALVLVLDQAAPEPELLERDLKGSQALLHAFTAWGDPRLVLVVTSALLADPEPVEPDVPMSRYGSAWLATRAAVEARCLHLVRRLALETVVVRVGHVYGDPDVRGGGLETVLEQVRTSAASGEELALPGLGIGLPFVAAEPAVEAIAARLDGTLIPGEQVLVEGFSRVDAVSAVWTLAELHDALAGLAGRPARRKELATRDPGLTSRLIGSLVPSKAPEPVPDYRRRAPMRLAPRAWRKAHGERRLEVDAGTI